VGERKGEIDEDDKGVYFVWLDGNGMREGGGLFPSYSIKSEMERKSCDRKFIFDFNLYGPRHLLSLLFFFLWSIKHMKKG
jgi:hypothetical protein